MTSEQRARKTAYDRVRKVKAAEVKRKRMEKLRAREEQMKPELTKEENIENTKTWWGKP